MDKNIYGVDDPFLYSFTQCLIRHIEIEALRKVVAHGIYIGDSVKIIRQSFVIYDKLKPLQKLKRKIGKDPNKIKDFFKLQSFCKEVINYYADGILNKYKEEINTFMKNGGQDNLIAVWNPIVIQERNRIMIKNFINKRKEIHNNKDNLMIVGFDHVPGISKILFDMGFEVRLLKSK